MCGVTTSDGSEKMVWFAARRESAGGRALPFIESAGGLLLAVRARRWSHHAHAKMPIAAPTYLSSSTYVLEEYFGRV